MSSMDWTRNQPGDYYGEGVGLTARVWRTSESPPEWQWATYDVAPGVGLLASGSETTMNAACAAAEESAHVSTDEGGPTPHVPGDHDPGIVGEHEGGSPVPHPGVHFDPPPEGHVPVVPDTFVPITEPGGGQAADTRARNSQ